MLRLRNSILTCLRSSSVRPLHRLLSAAAVAPAPAASPNTSFVVEDYLVHTCGLTRAQALKASARISHLKSPSKPDAVLAFLAGLGLSGADVAALVARDPQFLCAKVEGTLAPNVVGLTGLGLHLPRDAWYDPFTSLPPSPPGHPLSCTEIARLASLVPLGFRHRSIVSNLPYCLSLFGSLENLLRAIKRGSYILTADLENTLKPTVEYLQECGLRACDIAKLCIAQPCAVGTNLERVQAMVARAESLGVPRGSVMFRHALQAVAFLSEEKIAAQVEYLKNTFRWSDDDVGVAVSKQPYILVRCKDRLKCRSDFLISEVGLEPAYIAHRTALLTCSLEGRLKPRYYAVKFLKENGLVKRGPSYDTVVKLTEKVFMEKFICPHKEAAPHLAEDYATACTGEVTTRFRFA